MMKMMKKISENVRILDGWRFIHGSRVCKS